MRWLSRITGTLHALMRRDRVDAELDEELRDYLVSAVDAKVAAGMTRDEAVRHARAELGSPAAVRDWVRDAGWESRLESLWQDVRHAARALRRSPGFTVAATVTLALGIGATTAIFTIVEAVILRPLPIADADRVVTLQIAEPGTTQRMFTYPTFSRFRDHGTAAFDTVAASGNAGLRVRAGGEMRQVLAAFVTENYFDVLGIHPSHGRSFAASEHLAGAAPTVVVTDAFWRARMGADPAAIGQQIQVADTYATVVGVTPRSFNGLKLGSPVDLFLPLMTTSLVLPPANYLSDTPATIGGGRYSPQAWMEIIGRLKRDASIQQAVASVPAANLVRPGRSPRDATETRLVPTTSAALSPGTQADTRRFATLLAAVVTLVLLVGCANLSGLLVARIEQRRRETAVRVALGAGRGRVARLFLAESVLLSTAGALGGLLLAHWMLQAMSDFVIPGRIRIESLQLGLTTSVILFSGAAAVFTALITGLLPAVLGSRVNIASGLARRVIGPAPGRGVARAALVAAQVGISLILVAGAMLFVRSVREALATNVGADASRVAYATVSFWTAGYDDARLARFNLTMVERLSGSPGVERASFGGLPLAAVSGSTQAFRIDGAGRRFPDTLEFPCGPDYFATVGIEVVAGRALSTDDGRLGAPPAVVINEAFALHAWPGQNPVGRRVFIEPQGPEFLVVGVARDGKYPESGGRRAPRFVHALAHRAAQCGRRQGNLHRAVRRRRAAPRTAAAGDRSER